MKIRLSFNYVDAVGNKVLITGTDEETGYYFGMDEKCFIRMYDKAGKCMKINTLKNMKTNKDESLNLLGVAV